MRKVLVLAGKLIPFLAFLFISCAGPRYSDQLRLRGLLRRADYPGAGEFLESKSGAYGSNNRLLYLLERGLIAHFAGQYSLSVEFFDRAKTEYEELYTKSLSGIALTWLANDYSSPYRGEDFERAMISVFQSLNYLMTGKLEEALVEARQVDEKLRLIDSSYDPGEKNVYREDAFVRLLMGIIYETSPRGAGLNDAFVSYRNSEKIYEDIYSKTYGVPAPLILKENLLTASEIMGRQEYISRKNRYPGIKALSPAEKAEKAEVYLIHYNGFSPIKEERAFMLPLPDGYVVKYSFPQYVERDYRTRSGILKAVSDNGREFSSQSELAEDIGAIAVENLNRRRVRFVAKAVASSTGKYFLERKQEENIRKKYGDTTGDIFRLFSNLFNLVSSRADLRCWQSLPAQIRISRLLIDPGEYSLSFTGIGKFGEELEDIGLGKVKLSPGDRRFFAVRGIK